MSLRSWSPTRRRSCSAPCLAPKSPANTAWPIGLFSRPSPSSPCRWAMCSHRRFAAAPKRTRSRLWLARFSWSASVWSARAPILLAGALAPSFAAPLLGAKWAATGGWLRLVDPCLGAGARHALVEITSIYRFQMLRFKVELQTGALVFAARGVGASMQMSALATIWLMSTAGAAGTLIGLALVWSAFQRKLANLDSEPAAITPSAATS